VGWATLNGDAFESWLVEPERAELEPIVRQQLRRMNDLSARHMGYLLAAFQRYEIPVDSNLTPEAHALRLFLDSPEGFDYAWSRYLLSANAETLTHYYFPVRDLDLGADALSTLKHGVGEYFERAAKGK